MARTTQTNTPLHDFKFTYKWQREYRDRLKRLSDLELFEEILEDASGDDYDGAFTDRGWWRYCYLVARFRNRLNHLWIEGYG